MTNVVSINNAPTTRSEQWVRAICCLLRRRRNRKITILPSEISELDKALDYEQPLHLWHRVNDDGSITLSIEPG